MGRRLAPVRAVARVTAHVGVIEVPSRRRLGGIYRHAGLRAAFASRLCARRSPFMFRSPRVRPRRAVHHCPGGGDFRTGGSASRNSAAVSGLFAHSAQSRAVLPSASWSRGSAPTSATLSRFPSSPTPLPSSAVCVLRTVDTTPEESFRSARLDTPNRTCLLPVWIRTALEQQLHDRWIAAIDRVRRALPSAFRQCRCVHPRRAPPAHAGPRPQLRRRVRNPPASTLDSIELLPLPIPRQGKWHADGHECRQHERRLAPTRVTRAGRPRRSGATTHVRTIDAVHEVARALRRVDELRH